MTTNRASTALELPALLDDPQVQDLALPVAGPVRLRTVAGAACGRPPIPQDTLTLTRIITGTGQAP